MELTHEQNIMKESDSADNSTVKEPYILFELAGTTYGIHSRNVQQMEMLENITPVPNTPGYIDGVMFSRGQVIPVINLRKRLGMEPTDYDLRTRVIVVRYGDRTAGLIVDSAREYLNLDSGSIQESPGFIAGLSGSYLEGIFTKDDRVILIFRIEGIFRNEEHSEFINKL
jgi:purine-binding chemotaxis protein CheW